MVLNHCINSLWINCEVVPAPVSVTEGSRSRTRAPRRFTSSSCYIEGNLQSEGAGTVGGQSVHVGDLHIKVGGTGTSGTVLLALPEGFRPRSQEIFGAYADGQLARVDVRPSGEVVLRSNHGSNLSLSGIRFSIY